MKYLMPLRIVFALAIVLFSCKTENSQSLVPKGYEDGVLVFFKVEFFDQELESLDEDGISRLKEKVQKHVSEEFEGLEVDLKEIHFGKDSWFFAEKINSSQLKQLERGVSGEFLNEFVSNDHLDLQGRKPMMQSNPIPQGRKPQMQEDWRYDAARNANDFVVWVGGGMVGQAPSHKTVWIVDTGIDKEHQDLNGVVVTNLGYSAQSTSEFKDENGHGTMIAGIIGAISYNQNNPLGKRDSIGINGIYPGARMVSVKVLDEKGNSNMSKLSKGVDYILANAQPGDVVNMSLGRENNNNCNWGRLDDKIRDLASKGIYVVFSAGNETSSNSDNFPSCLADGNFLLSVGSMNMFCEGDHLIFSSFSNYGEMSSGSSTLPIWLAPGEQIFTTFKTTSTNKGVYAMGSGTSYSAAFMSGLLYKLSGKPSGTTQILRGGDGISYPVAKIE